MPKEIKYKILYNTTLLYLELEVEKYLRDGWELQGGVSAGKQFQMLGDVNCYYQAMIKKS